MRNEWNRDEEKSPVTFVLQVRESAPACMWYHRMLPLLGGPLPPMLALKAQRLVSCAANELPLFMLP